MNAQYKRITKDPDSKRSSFNHSGNTESEVAQPDVGQQQKKGLRRDRFLWIELVGVLRQDSTLRSELLAHFELICLPKSNLKKKPHVIGQVLSLISMFGNQNCLRALSVMDNLQSIKKNQYKFMYEKMTLAQSIETLISETCFLKKSLVKHKAIDKQFLRLVRTWVDYINIIHSVPEDIREELKEEIITQVALRNGLPLWLALTKVLSNQISDVCCQIVALFCDSQGRNFSALEDLKRFQFL